MKAGIFYFTTSGNTEAMAQALQTGLEAGGAEVVCKPVSEADDSDLEGCDMYLLGTPAQGTEEIDDAEFYPFYNEHRDTLKTKPVFLFGSFGWGGGEYLRNFAKTIADEDKVNVVEVYTHLEAPDDDTISELEEKGKALVG